MREIFASTISALSEMRDRVISTVVAHSRTNRELVELRERFEQLNQRMTSVIEEAQTVRQNLGLVIAERDKYKHEAEESLSLASTYQNERDEARKLASERQDIVNNQGLELHERQRKLNELNHTVVTLGDDNKYLRENRDMWREKHGDALAQSTKAQVELKEAQDRLTRLQGVMRDIFPVVEATKPVELPGQAPSFLPQQQPHPLQSVGEQVAEVHNVNEVGEKGVNERIDDKPQEEPLPWWDKKTRETGF